jgi:hypothetical protein
MISTTCVDKMFGVDDGKGAFFFLTWGVKFLNTFLRNTIKTLTHHQYWILFVYCSHNTVDFRAQQLCWGKKKCRPDKKRYSDSRKTTNARTLYFHSFA